jgi:hypothetical protein
MTSPTIERWVNQTGARGARAFSVHALVFGVGGILYFLYRTRLQIVNLVVRLILHIMEYLLIFHTMPSLLITAIIMRVMGIAIESGWWGMLDTMRIRIRKLSEKGNIAAIRDEIEDWMALAVWLGAGVIVCCLMALLFLHKNASHDMLILAIGIQLSVRLTLRTLYSGIYAIKRVYIRFEWIIASELAMFLLAWIVYPYLQSWTLPLCLLASCILTSYISFYFIRRSMEFMRITPNFFAKPLQHIGVAQNHTLKNTFLPGFAMVSTKIQDVVLIVILQIVLSQQGDDDRSLLFAMYLVIPAVRTAMGWAQIMYFDLTRHHLDVFKNFRRNFEIHGLAYSVLYGAAISVLMAIALMIVMPTVEHYIPSIAIYIVLSSALGFVQVGLFTRQKHTELVLLAAFQYVLLYKLLANSTNFTGAFSISLMLPALIGWLLLTKHTKENAEQERSFMQWTRAVALKHTPLLVVVLKLIDGTNLGSRRHLSEQFTTVFGPHIIFCYHRSNFMLVLERDHKLVQNEINALLKTAAGYIKEISQYSATNGETALSQLNQLPYEGIELNANKLLEIFRQIFPEGYIQIPMHRNPAFASKVETSELLKLAKNAVAFTEGKKQETDTTWHVSAAQKNGVIETIFIVAKDAMDPERRNHWIEIIRAYNKGQTSLPEELQWAQASPL